MVRRNGIFSFDAKLEELVDECEHRESVLSAIRAEPPHLKKSLYSPREFLCYVSLSCHVRMRKGEEVKTKREREKETEKKEGGRARNSARKEKKREGGISTGGSAEELHTEELENALFRLHSHRFRWVCREREIPAK